MRNKLLASFLPLLLMLGGCATDPGQISPLASIAVQYATAKVIGNNPDALEKAQRILVVVGDARSTLQGDTASTVALLKSAVISQIKWDKLDAADTILVNALIEEVANILTERLGDGVLDPDKTLVVDKVLGWVETAAAAYATGS